MRCRATTHSQCAAETQICQEIIQLFDMSPTDMSVITAPETYQTLQIIFLPALCTRIFFQLCFATYCNSICVGNPCALSRCASAKFTGAACKSVSVSSLLLLFTIRTWDREKSHDRVRVSRSSVCWHACAYACRGRCLWAHSALKIGVRRHFVLGLCFSKHGCFSFKKLFYLYIYFLFSIDIKKFLRSFKDHWEMIPFGVCEIVPLIRHCVHASMSSPFSSSLWRLVPLLVLLRLL